MVLKSPEQGGSSYNKSNPIEGIEGIGGEDIRKMLSVIPPRPDYDTWLRIASAVWSQLGMAEGARLLQEWSPAEKAGEYAAKHKARLKQVGVGTLIHHAKQHGFDFVGWRKERAERAARHRFTPCITHRPATLFRPKGERLTFAATATPAPPTPRTIPAPRIDMAEAEGIAEELHRLHKRGAIRGADDPNLRYFARLVLSRMRDTEPPIHPEDDGTIY